MSIFLALRKKLGTVYLRTHGQDSVAGSVNQATGLPDFEDGSRTGTKLEVRNGLQSIRTIPEVNIISPLGLAMILGAVWGTRP